VTTALPEVASVCNGNLLELNCTITGSALQRRFIPEKIHSQLSVLAYSPSRNDSESNFHYGDSAVTFIIISYPTEMTLYIIELSPVTNNLNGTVVECTDLEDQESSSSTVIVVNDQGNVLYNIITSHGHKAQSTSESVHDNDN
jgi:hypothetical protein